jgi:hypothetical protein
VRLPVLSRIAEKKAMVEVARDVQPTFGMGPLRYCQYGSTDISTPSHAERITQFVEPFMAQLGQPIFSSFYGTHRNYVHFWAAMIPEADTLVSLLVQLNPFLFQKALRKWQEDSLPLMEASSLVLFADEFFSCIKKSSAKIELPPTVIALAEALGYPASHMRALFIPFVSTRWMDFVPFSFQRDVTKLRHLSNLRKELLDDAHTKQTLHICAEVLAECLQVQHQRLQCGDADNLPR